MKHYNITFEVPDDFNPEELELNASYKDAVEIFSEGFSDVVETIKSVVSDKLSLNKITVSDNDVILFKVDKDCGLDDYEFAGYLNAVKETIEETCKCPVIGFVGDIDLLVENADEAIDMLNGMIAKVKVRSAVKDTSKIILT